MLSIGRFTPVSFRANNQEPKGTSTNEADKENPTGRRELKPRTERERAFLDLDINTYAEDLKGKK